MKLILNDGTEIEGGAGWLADGFLWLQLPGLTMRQAVGIAFDESRTARIEYFLSSEDAPAVFEGFTECEAIMKDRGKISVCLVKG